MLLSSFHRYKYSYQVDAFSYTLPVQVLSKRGRGRGRRQEPLKRRNNQLFSTKTPVPPSKNIAIVGGGLAGLSTAYHLLSKSIDYNLNLPSITIFDKTQPGQGGASSVAGGLLHPFSPRGKLIHLGKEGLEITNHLIDMSQQHNPNSSCILRDKLYRLAQSDKNVKQLQETSLLHPEHATWLSSQDIEDRCHSSTTCLGGIVLENGCKVIHVPTYLQGLWNACQSLSSPDKTTWSIVDDDDDDESSTTDQYWNDCLQDYDTVIFSAGSGLFHDSIFKQDSNNFPVELVRGQSVEMTIEDDIVSSSDFSNDALLCGKYMAPIPSAVGTNKVLIGATHEYKEEALDSDDVVQDLRNRSFDISHFVWENGRVDNITLGYRVQSRRGKFGRMPIIGKSQYCDVHPNSWLFTGLSARGLIYHGVYGEMLSEAILKDDEEEILKVVPEAFWWKAFQNS